MIKKLIRRILDAGSGRAGKIKPKVYEKSEHNIALDDVSANAVRVTNTLQDAGFKAFIVGGAVRDLLLGYRPKDFDVATNATPDEVKRLFRR
ncbi:MAG: polynucleotide adenylyltransferase PcnB, partial [Burkholderiaceae bacterium]